VAHSLIDVGASTFCFPMGYIQDKTHTRAIPQPMQTPMNCGNDCGVSEQPPHGLRVIADQQRHVSTSVHHAVSDSTSATTPAYKVAVPPRAIFASGAIRSHFLTSKIAVFSTSTPTFPSPDIAFWDSIDPLGSNSLYRVADHLTNEQ
jgi:hypothetical protein